MAKQGALDKPSHSALPADSLFQSNTLTYQLICGAIHQTAHPVPRMTFISSFRFVKCSQSLYVALHVCVRWARHVARMGEERGCIGSW